MTFSLRPYQLDAIDAARRSYARGLTAPILCVPTGGGKTVIASSIVSSAVARGRKVFFLAHRFELIEQASLKLGIAGIEHQILAPPQSGTAIRISHVRSIGRNWTRHDACVAVGTVQTIARRLDRLPFQPDLIVIDECHLSVAPTYTKIVEEFPRARLLGLTGTPTRLDGKGLGKHAGGLYDDLVVVCQPQQLLDDGFLVPARVFTSQEPPDLAGVHRRGGDFDAGELTEAIDKPKLIGDVVDHYARLARGRPAMMFNASVQHAEHTAEAFRAAGFRAVAVSGDTDPAVRARAVRQLGTGDIDVVCNCALYIEGLDQPSISCIGLMTPTESLPRYLQSIGRGLRPADRKSDCIILDHAHNVFRHGMPQQDREWSLDGRAKRRGKQESTIGVRQCPKCFLAHEPKPACPHCGHVYTVAPRELTTGEGELTEIVQPQKITAADRSGARDVESLAQIAMARGKSAGSARAWAQHVVAARERKQAAQRALTERLRTYTVETGIGWHRQFQISDGDIRGMSERTANLKLAEVETAIERWRTMQATG